MSMMPSGSCAGSRAAGAAPSRPRVSPRGITTATPSKSTASSGALGFDFPNFSFLEFSTTTRSPGSKRVAGISCTRGEHPYAGNYWPTDHPIGYAEMSASTPRRISSTDLAGSGRGFRRRLRGRPAATGSALAAVACSRQRARWVKIKEWRNVPRWAARPVYAHPPDSPACFAVTADGKNHGKTPALASSTSLPVQSCFTNWLGTHRPLPWPALAIPDPFLSERFSHP